MILPILAGFALGCAVTFAATLIVCLIVRGRQ